jgi:hypothetical protein
VASSKPQLIESFESLIKKHVTHAHVAFVKDAR